MIYEVIITDQANADLRGIYEYITFELLSPDNAAGQLDRLEEHILGLEEFPEKYRLYGNEPWHSRGLRVMPVDNYLVFYIPDKDTGSVTREAITRKEEKTFLKFLQNDEHFSRYYDGVFILFKTGLRISEFCGLTIKDIDFDNKRISVNHQLQRTRDIPILELMMQRKK